MKSAVDEAYAAADNTGVEGIQKMNEMLHKFKSWCNKKQYENPESNDKRDMFQQPKKITKVQQKDFLIYVAFLSN